MRTSLLLLCLAVTLPVHARADEPKAEPPFKAVTGAFFALSVADMDEAVQWYSEKLGLQPVMQVPKRDKSAVTVLEGGGLIVELVQNDDSLPLTRAAPGVSDRGFIHGLFKVGIVVEGLERTLSRLRERGIEIAAGPFPASGDQRANVLIRDNSGNLIQFFGE